jgi:hypothetical protein
MDPVVQAFKMTPSMTPSMTPVATAPGPRLGRCAEAQTSLGDVADRADDERREGWSVEFNPHLEAALRFQLRPNLPEL